MKLEIASFTVPRVANRKGGHAFYPPGFSSPSSDLLLDGRRRGREKGRKTDYRNYARSISGFYDDISPSTIHKGKPRNIYSRHGRVASSVYDIVAFHCRFSFSTRGCNLPGRSRGPLLRKACARGERGMAGSGGMEKKERRKR